jgi:hypothetical protein
VTTPVSAAPFAAGTGLPWDVAVTDAVAAVGAARSRCGDTFVVESGSERYLFTFSPTGVESLHRADSRQTGLDWSGSATIDPTRSMKESGTPIADYEDVAARKDLIKQFADHLPGDPTKVAEAVLMLTGLDEPPLRLLLGRDVLKAMRDKIAALTTSINEWEAVTRNVNFPAP